MILVKSLSENISVTVYMAMAFGTNKNTAIV